MPINTSMNIWSRIASDMDIESHSPNDHLDPLNKTLAGFARQENKFQITGQPGKSCLLNHSKSIYQKPF